MTICITFLILNMGRNESIRERLQRKLAVSTAIKEFRSESHHCGDPHCTDNHNHCGDPHCTDNHNRRQEMIPEEILFDVNTENIKWLGEAIRNCVARNIDLKPYSSLAFKHPNTPLTQIPGLTSIFQQACINHGLLGYLDWGQRNQTI
jgi:hypothetical protein